MWHRADARYVPYGDLANHTFVEPSAASGIVCSLWWGQFASRFCVSCGRCVCARARARANTYTRASSCSPCASVRMAIAAASVCMYARARTRESLRMSLVTPGVTPGFALTIPGYQHRPPCTTDREELHYALLTILAPCAKHCREPPRRCSLCEVCIALIRYASISSTWIAFREIEPFFKSSNDFDHSFSIIFIRVIDESIFRYNRMKINDFFSE